MWFVIDIFVGDYIVLSCAYSINCRYGVLGQPSLCASWPCLPELSGGWETDRENIRLWTITGHLFLRLLQVMYCTYVFAVCVFIYDFLYMYVEYIVSLLPVTCIEVIVLILSSVDVYITISESRARAFFQCDGCLQSPYCMENSLQNQMCGALEWCCGKYLVMACRWDATSII